MQMQKRCNFWRKRNHEGNTTECVLQIYTVNPNATKEISKQVTENDVDYMEIPVMEVQMLQ